MFQLQFYFNIQLHFLTKLSIFYKKVIDWYCRTCLKLYFFRAKNRKSLRLDRHGKIHYYIFHHVWIAYLRLINIDYQKCFTCPICKDCPDVVIFDGVTPSTSKEVPSFSMQFDKSQLIPPVPQVLVHFSHPKRNGKTF